jgi:hypothetical protein
MVMFGVPFGLEDLYIITVTARPPGHFGADDNLRPADQVNANSGFDFNALNIAKHQSATVVDWFLKKIPSLRRTLERVVCVNVWFMGSISTTFNIPFHLC